MGPGVEGGGLSSHGRGGFSSQAMWTGDHGSRSTVRWAFERLRSRPSIILSVVMIVSGTFSIIFSIVLIIFHSAQSLDGFGIWCGVWYIVTGTIGMLAARRKTKRLVVVFLVLCIISTVMSFVQLFLSLVVVNNIQIGVHCAYRRMLPFSSYDQELEYAYKCSNTDVSVAMEALQVVLATVVAMAAISCCCLCCAVTCCYTPAARASYCCNVYCYERTRSEPWRSSSQDFRQEPAPIYRHTTSRQEPNDTTSKMKSDLNSDQTGRLLTNEIRTDLNRKQRGREVSHDTPAAAADQNSSFVTDSIYSGVSGSNLLPKDCIVTPLCNTIT